MSLRPIDLDASKRLSLYSPEALAAFPVAPNMTPSSLEIPTLPDVPSEEEATETESESGENGIDDLLSRMLGQIHEPAPASPSIARTTVVIIRAATPENEPHSGDAHPSE